MNNNYVPEWYTTPFEHMHYTLVRNQDQLDILFDTVKAPFEFLESGADARVTFNDDHAIVQIKDCDWVHGDIRHLEMTVFNSRVHTVVHGDIRHLEITFPLFLHHSIVHGDIRHLENASPV